MQSLADMNELREGPADAGRTLAHLDIDLDSDGVCSGHVFLPHSPHDDAWGAQLIPIISIRNGEGPVVLIEAGNHGDEYEGQIAACELARDLDPATICGQIIILPAINAPAARAGTRCSPVDGQNFNRAFPGSSGGSLTGQIAQFVTTELMSRADFFIDLHSGGSSLQILPSAIVEAAKDPSVTAANFRAASAFGAPCIAVVNNLGEPRTATATASRLGLVTVGTELNGGGYVDSKALALCRQGLARLLSHAGISTGPVPEPAAPAHVLMVAKPDCYHRARNSGVLERCVELGDAVAVGDLLGRLHDPFNPLAPPVALHARIEGIAFAIRHPARVAPGNCCFVIAETGKTPIQHLQNTGRLR